MGVGLGLGLVRLCVCARASARVCACACARGGVCVFADKRVAPMCVRAWRLGRRARARVYVAHRLMSGCMYEKVARLHSEDDASGHSRWREASEAAAAAGAAAPPSAFGMEARVVEDEGGATCVFECE